MVSGTPARSSAGIAAPSEAGAAYNRELTAADKATSFAVFHQDAVKLKALARAIADGVRATRWPAAVQPTANRFADAIAGDVLYWVDEINARSWDEANAVSPTPHNNAAKGAEQMREALGLPSIS